MIRGLLFDADNTIYNTRVAAKKANLKAFSVFAEQTGVSPKKIYAEWQRHINSLKKKQPSNLKFGRWSYPVFAKKLGVAGSRKAYAIFEKELLRLIRPEPNAKTILRRLNRKYKVALFTESYRALTLKKLETTGLKKFFPVIITKTEICGFKPNKKYFTEALARIKLPQRECLVVGDDYKRDILPAARLGLRTVIYREPKRKADFRINNLSEIETVLKKLNSPGYQNKS